MASRQRSANYFHAQLETILKFTTKKELAARLRSSPKVVQTRFNPSKFPIPQTDPEPINYIKPEILDDCYDSKSSQSHFWQMFETATLISEGDFGYIYCVQPHNEYKLYAVKRIRNMQDIDRLSEIINYQKILPHVNIVKYYFGWEENKEIFMKLECCDLSLAELSLDYHTFDEEFLCAVLYDICNALHYLHAQNFIHLDVKLAHILTNKGYFKLCDFGIMLDLNDDNLQSLTVPKYDPKYVAPEILQKVYLPACDIFSLGLCLFELATDVCIPSDGITWGCLRQGFLPIEFFDKVSRALGKIVERMVNQKYNARPSAAAILNYRTIKDFVKEEKKNGHRDYYNQFKNQMDYKNHQKFMIFEDVEHDPNAVMAHNASIHQPGDVCGNLWMPSHKFGRVLQTLNSNPEEVAEAARSTFHDYGLVERKSECVNEPEEISVPEHLIFVVHEINGKLYNMDSVDVDRKNVENVDRENVDIKMEDENIDFNFSFIKYHEN